MPDGVERLMAKLANLERRIRTLETAPRATHLSATGGRTRWLDDDGNETVAFGMEDSGETFVRMSNPDHTDDGLNIIDGAWHAPLISAGWTKTPERPFTADGDPFTTSGNYTALWRTVVPATSGRLDTNFVAIPGSGVTEMAVRVRALTLPSTAAAVTLHEETGITVAVNVTGPWTIPDSVTDPARNPIGLLIDVFLEARVTGGTGEAAIAPSYPLYNSV